MALQRVPINNFRGGLNTRDSPFELQPNESPDLLNVTITDLVGLLQVRKGLTRFDTNCPGTVDFARMVSLAGQAPVLMCSINGAVYSMDSGGVFTLRFTGTAATVWDFAQMPDAAAADRVWMCNGVDTPQKWDGVTALTVNWAGSTVAAWNRVLVWKSRLIALALGSVRVYFSKTGDPEQTTGAYDFVDLRGDDDDLEANTDMNILADRLFVFKNRSTWIVTDPSTLTNRRLGEPGCSSRFQSDVCDGKLYFFNEQGLWSTGGVTVAYESGSINSFFPARLTVAQVAKVRVLATRDTFPRLLISLPIDGSTVNNAMIETVPNINFRRIGGRRYLLLPAFMLHTLDASCLANYKLATAAQWGIFGGRTSVAQLHQFFSGTTDAGTVIPAYWQSSWISIQGEEPFERIRRLNVELGGDAFVDVFKDFSSTPDVSFSLPQSTAVDLVTNSSFVNDLLGSFPANWAVTDTLGLPTVVVALYPGIGGSSMRVTKNGFTAVEIANLQPVLTSGGLINTAYSYSAATDYNVQTNTSSAHILLILTWLNGGLPIGSIQSSQVATGTGTLTLPPSLPPAGTTSAQLQLQVRGTIGTGNIDMYFDNIHVFAANTFRFARVRPESRGRFHAIRFRSNPAGSPFQINVAELAVRGGKEH